MYKMQAVCVSRKGKMAANHEHQTVQSLTPKSNVIQRFYTKIDP